MITTGWDGLVWLDLIGLASSDNKKYIAGLRQLPISFCWTFKLSRFFYVYVFLSSTFTRFLVSKMRFQISILQTPLGNRKLFLGRTAFTWFYYLNQWLEHEVQHEVAGTNVWENPNDDDNDNERRTLQTTWYRDWISKLTRDVKFIPR